MKRFEDVLREFYANEVLGETIYSALFEGYRQFLESISL